MTRPHPLTPAGKAVFAALRQRWRQLYDSGLIDAAIARELGVPQMTVGGWRRREGLPRNEKRRFLCGCGREMDGRHAQCYLCRHPMDMSSPRFLADPVGWLAHLDRLAERAREEVPLF